MATAQEDVHRLQEELLRAQARARKQAWLSRSCRVCGERTLEAGGTIEFLTSFELSIASGEEGDSTLETWLCEDDLEHTIEALSASGIVMHSHGGICLLEARACPGYSTPEACPTPERQFQD